MMNHSFTWFAPSNCLLSGVLIQMILSILSPAISLYQTCMRTHTHEYNCTSWEQFFCVAAASQPQGEDVSVSAALTRAPRTAGPHENSAQRTQLGEAFDGEVPRELSGAGYDGEIWGYHPRIWDVPIFLGYLNYRDMNDALSRRAITCLLTHGSQLLGRKSPHPPSENLHSSPYGQVNIQTDPNRGSILQLRSPGCHNDTFWALKRGNVQDPAKKGKKTARTTNKNNQKALGVPGTQKGCHLLVPGAQVKPGFKGGSWVPSKTEALVGWAVHQLWSFTCTLLDMGGGNLLGSQHHQVLTEAWASKVVAQMVPQHFTRSF